MKRFLSVLAALGLVAGLANCGGSEKNESNAGSGSSAAETEESSEDKSDTREEALIDHLTFEVSPTIESNQVIAEFFPQIISIWGINIVATEATPESKILHAANVMAQYLDNDENGIPDDQRVIDALVKNKAVVTMAADEDEFEETINQIIQQGLIPVFEEYGFQDLYASETNPDEQFDASLEEIHHLILNYGWAEVFPDELAQQRGSAIANAMDIARGGVFETVPETYPDGAWFTYDDWTCDYECMITEYTYWAHTSLLGGQVGRLEQIGWEWRLETPEKVRSGDSAAVEIFENPKLGLPVYLPDGKYEHREEANASSSNEDVENQTIPINSVLEIVDDASFESFTKYADVAGLRIFSLPDVSNEFLLAVAEIYRQMLGDNNHIDKNLRDRYLNRVSEDYVFQRIGYLGPENYKLDSPNPDIDCCPGKNYEDNHTDYIWEYPNAFFEEQAGEVIEHLLHTVTGVGFALEFSEWDWEDTNSKIHVAMNEAVEKNIYDISSYEEIKERGNIEDFNRIVIQEFSFWFIITAWGFADLWNMPHEEFRISTIDELQEELPIANELFEDTVKKILTPPNKTDLRSLFPAAE